MAKEKQEKELETSIKADASVDAEVKQKENNMVSETTENLSASNLIKEFESEQLKKELPEIYVGDTVKVGVKITEGNKERVQAFEGICIARSNRGFNSTFTVRKVSHGEGVERVFPLYSPMLESIKLIRRGKVKRSKLYYLRQRSGKSARIAEKKDFIKKKPQASKVVDAPASSEEVKEESK